MRIYKEKDYILKYIPTLQEFRKLFVEVSYSMGLLSAATVDFRIKYSKCFDMSDYKRIEALKSNVQKGHIDSKRIMMSLNRIEQKLKKKCEDKKSV